MKTFLLDNLIFVSTMAEDRSVLFEGDRSARRGSSETQLLRVEVVACGGNDANDIPWKRPQEL